MTNPHGLKVQIMTYGATITDVEVPDRNGKLANVTLYLDSLADYIEHSVPTPFFGAIAGRYANRIAKGKFTLDGKEYTLATNDGPNHLHGGKKGFDKASGRPSRSKARTPSALCSPTSAPTARKAIPASSPPRHLQPDQQQ